MTYSQCDTSGPITYCDLNVTLRAILKQKFDRSPMKDAIGSMVRLTFHCMGPPEYNLNGAGPISICDGCVDPNNSAHSGIFELAVNYLERQYLSRNNPFRNRISRADFWAAAGTIALQYASELDNNGTFENDSLPFIPFYIGRSDCSAAPDINITNYESTFKSFPEGHHGYTDNYQFFKDNFNFTVKEFVAILGAHTLGRVHNKFSGFGGGCMCNHVYIA